MFRSLHMKLVLILILLIVSVMAVMGTFLINSVGNFYLQDFQAQIEGVFSVETLVSLNQAAQEGGERVGEVLSAFSSGLGIDNYRHYYIIDKDTNNIIVTAPPAPSASLTNTPNLIAAKASTSTTNTTIDLHMDNAVIDSFMDAALLIGRDDHQFIIYVKDDKVEIQELSMRFFTIVMQAMLFGLLVAVLLSFLLSKTITIPIENIKAQAQLVASGDFSHRLEIQSGDEIGNLTQTFNSMAEVLKNTLEEVQGERDKLNTLFLHMTDGVTAFTAEGKLIHMNPATERLMGVRFEEQMTFNQVFSGMLFPTAFDTGERGYIQCEISRMGRTLNVVFAPYGAVDGERGIIGVIHDVTEQRKLDDARREFVANVSHELRTPLTNIKSYTETLIDAAGELPGETEVRFLGVISSEADRMTRIVKDLLTLSKLDYGRMDLRFTKFSMQEMLEAVYTAMKLDAENNGHELELFINDYMPEMNGDRERLEQVIINIISNSIKYTPNGGHISLTASKRDKHHIMLRVQDDGMGIPKDDVPRLFERFYRVDKARSRQKGGTGLGLAIAKEMVEAHQGTIHLESELDNGTTVTIILPTNLPADIDKNET